MSKDPNRMQTLMNQSYARWTENDDAVRKEYESEEITLEEARHKKWSYEDFIGQCSSEEKLAAIIGIFNGQVCNGGFSQYHDNRYSAFVDDLVSSLKKVQNAKVFEVMPKVVTFIEVAIPLFGELDSVSQNADCYCVADDDDDCHCDDTSDYDYVSQQLDDLSSKYYELDEQFLVEAEMLFDDDLNYVGDQLEMIEKEPVSTEGLPKLKPKVKLLGADGDVFNIIGLTKRALNKAGLKEEAKKFSEEAMSSGDYNKVLQLCMQYAEVY